MDGRNEIASAGGVPGNRHATSVPTAFPQPARLGRDPLDDRRAGSYSASRRTTMRSLVHEAVVQRTWTEPRHGSWDPVPTPTRRAVLRRALRQGWLRPAVRLGRRQSAPDEQIPADHEDAEPKQQPGLPDPARVAAP